MPAEKKRHESGESTDSADSVGDYIPTPPDGGWGWVIVASSLMCNIIVDGLGYSFGVLLPQWVEVFGESRSKVSLVGSLLVGVYLCAGPLVSGLTNKFGCRPVTIAGSILSCAGFLLASVSNSVDVLFITYGLMGGLGFGLIYLPAIVSVGYYFEKRRAIATGIAVCGSGIGTFIFAPANAAMLEAFDWKNMLMIQAGVILNGCVCGMLMRPLELQKKKKRARKKTVIDRVKEKAIANRKRHGESESSVQVVETFAKLREAKLQREQKLNDEDSDVLSMPSAIFVRAHQDSESQSQNRDSEIRLYKHSFSEVGESCPASPASDIPKIVLSGVDQADSPKGDTDDKNESPRSVNPTERDDEKENQSPRSGNPIEVEEEKSAEEHIKPVNSTEGDDEKVEDEQTPNKQTESEKENRVNGNLLNGVYAHEVEPLIENGYAKISPSSRKEYSSAARLRISSQHNIDKKDYSRPLYRQDIFYSGSICNIPQYRSQPDMKSYITSITTIPGELEVIPPSSVWDKCTCLPKAVVDTLRDMLDFSLLKNFSFRMICLGNILAMIGFYVPFAYLVDHALQLNIDATKASFLLSVIGITNTIGRVLAGVLSDMTKVDALVINNVALIVSAVLLFLEPFCHTYELLLVFAALYGLCVAAYISLTSIIICDLLGLEKLTNAFGLLTLARGISSTCGPPIGGSVYAATGSYKYSFYLGGLMFALGAVCHLVLHLPCVKRNRDDDDIDVVEMKEVDSKTAVAV